MGETIISASSRNSYVKIFKVTTYFSKIKVQNFAFLLLVKQYYIEFLKLFFRQTGKHKATKDWASNRYTTTFNKY